MLRLRSCFDCAQHDMGRTKGLQGDPRSRRCERIRVSRMRAAISCAVTPNAVEGDFL